MTKDCSFNSPSASMLCFYLSLLVSVFPRPVNAATPTMELWLLAAFFQLAKVRGFCPTSPAVTGLYSKEFFWSPPVFLLELELWFRQSRGHPSRGRSSPGLLRGAGLLTWATYRTSVDCSFNWLLFPQLVPRFSRVSKPVSSFSCLPPSS